MKKLFLIAVVLFCCVFAFSACANNETTDEPNNNEQVNSENDNEAVDTVAFTGEYVVDLEYVKNAVGQEDVIFLDARGPVSYTHLDVYKRQPHYNTTKRR